MDALQPIDPHGHAVDNYDDLPPRPSTALAGCAEFKYTPELCRKILIAIATTAKPIKRICFEHGIDESGYYKWLNGLKGTVQCHVRAMATRAIVESGANQAKWDALEGEIEAAGTEVAEIRRNDVKLRYLHLQTGHKEWLWQRYNRELYGDKQTIDLNVGLQPGEARRQAYMANVEARKRRDADAEIT